MTGDPPVTDHLHRDDVLYFSDPPVTERQRRCDYTSLHCVHDDDRDLDCHHCFQFRYQYSPTVRAPCALMIIAGPGRRTLCIRCFTRTHVGFEPGKRSKSTSRPTT